MAEAALRGLQLVFVYQDGLSHDVVPLVRTLYATAPDHVRDRAAFAVVDARFRAWLDAAGHDGLPRLCQCRVPGRLFQYALRAACTSTGRAHWSLAAKYEQLPVLAYYFAEHCDEFQPDMMARAAYRGHLSVVRFLHEAGVRGNSAGALIWASEHRSKNVPGLGHGRSRLQRALASPKP
ncbi:hypothetical protein SPRG_07478 [Saprolegnia parasitica CBS 223.65]|uniref:Ankyrin repeat protein n=1 Tax=Saprolegnia parasitica (strain CBS 223.65) TaxID=695850 RepID=A0A067C912_SAPPC|nr:hypothetical protein SPRG_07478 [Saprolegnia parasitica CBS 223.65]KDO27229.1 hypothetical protein SPRG_07478 [Saprolegnia parasitica CBS 223.65]|eukprot:XP_012202006.1 hypothetical protein SPRG_07478 [Saprolegnia parasitica CBS 223.65]